MNWLNYFDERQQKEIEFCRLYALNFNHGTDGHNAKLIIARMAYRLDEQENTLKEALMAIAKLTPFPVEGQEQALNDAINQTADYADSIRAMIRGVIGD